MYLHPSINYSLSRFQMNPARNLYSTDCLWFKKWFKNFGSFIFVDNVNLSPFNGYKPSIFSFHKFFCFRSAGSRDVARQALTSSSLISPVPNRYAHTFTSQEHIMSVRGWCFWFRPRPMVRKLYLVTPRQDNFPPSELAAGSGWLVINCRMMSNLIVYQRSRRCFGQILFLTPTWASFIWTVSNYASNQTSYIYCWNQFFRLITFWRDTQDSPGSADLRLRYYLRITRVRLGIIVCW